jgi:hypothetical protein
MEILRGKEPLVQEIREAKRSQEAMMKEIESFSLENQ